MPPFPASACTSATRSAVGIGRAISFERWLSRYKTALSANTTTLSDPTARTPASVSTAVHTSVSRGSRPTTRGVANAAKYVAWHTLWRGPSRRAQRLLKDLDMLAKTPITVVFLFASTLPFTSAYAQSSADNVGADSAVETRSKAAKRHLTPYSFGMRVGGYGFRQPEGADWNDCRMSGIGAFGERSIGRHAFVEGGADLYFAETQETALPVPQGMDRMSGLFTVAGGLRMFPGARASTYVQLGAGLELTEVRMTEGDHQHAHTLALPMGFVGIGADLKISRRLHLGASLRTYVMGHFAHDHGAETGALPVAKHDGTYPADAPAMTPEPEAAAQGQFYVRYTL